jgi:alkylated DNA repair dioxygenase AlkB
MSTLVDLSVAGADIGLTEKFIAAPSTVTLLAHLIAEIPWRQEHITLFGKTPVQPRLIAWMGDAGCRYRYSGKTYDPLPWTPLVAGLRDRISAASGHSFNSVLINYYRDGRDSMGLHSDDEPELGQQPVIASLSLGAARMIVFRHRHDKTVAPVRLPLSDGSLLTMRGDAQSNWKHEIPKTRRPVGARINLTFRRIVG